MKVPTTIPSRPVVRLKNYLFSHKSFLQLRQLQAISPMTLIDLVGEDIDRLAVVNFDLRNFVEVCKVNS